MPEDLRLGSCRARILTGPGNPKLSLLFGPCSQTLAQDTSGLAEECRNEPSKVQLWTPGTSHPHPLDSDFHLNVLSAKPRVLKVLGYMSVSLRGSLWHAFYRRPHRPWMLFRYGREGECGLSLLCLQSQWPAEGGKPSRGVTGVRKRWGSHGSGLKGKLKYGQTSWRGLYFC